MRSRKKVLHIMWAGGIGGMEDYVTAFIKYLDSSKYDIHLCFLSQKGAIYEEASKGNEKVAFIGMKNGYDIFGAIKFIRYLHKNKFDIFHLHTRVYLLSVVLSLFPGTHQIKSHHAGPGVIEAQKKSFRFYKLFSGQLNKVTAISETVKESLVKDYHVNPDKIEVIYNGVDLDKYDMSVPFPADLHHLNNTGKFTIGFIGRMSDQKRPRLFVEIASKIVERTKDCYFIMVGDGPELKACKLMIHDFGLSEYFTVLGFRRDVPGILKLLDALVFTAVGEGFGLVLIEAMAMGVPVFAINDGAVSEIINHKQNGILLEADNPEVIAKQIINIRGEKKLLEKIKNQCIKDVHAKFNIRHCAARMESVYEEVFR